MGFGKKWIKWMNFCISTVRFSVLINGSPEGFFLLREGFEVATNSNSNSNVNMEVTHLQYADDTLVFCDAEGQLLILRLILVLFEGISVLHINWRKSMLFPINEVTHGSKENKSTVLHLVKWSEVLWGRKQGGLGTKNLKLQSKALRVKWLWRYSQETQAYWSKVIKAKYRKENRWMTKEVHTPYVVGLWRSIRAL
ncbi:unnamed protein product [Withania somnifera]